VVEQVLPDPDRVVVVCRTRSVAASCPVCGQISSRVHSRYRRKLADLPWQGRVVSLTFWARRLHCANGACSRRIFTERLPDVAAPHARRTVRLGDIQGHLGATLGGEPGARLAKRLGMTVSGDTLLRLVRHQAPATSTIAPRVLGVDDWAELPQGSVGPWPMEWQRRGGVEAIVTARSSWIWSAAPSSTFCPTGTQTASPLGCVHTPASR